MEQITHRTLVVQGIRIHIAEQGSGPTVLFVHGFPSLWFTWRFQFSFLAKAGYHVVALDLRGFGESDIPSDPSKYTILHHAGDVVGLIDALGVKQVFLVGHDWGSVIASTVALFRPDLIRGLVNLSVPFNPRSEADYLSHFRAAHGDGVYINRWQSSENGEAEADFAKFGMKEGLRRVFGIHTPKIVTAKEGETILESMEVPVDTWLTEEDLQYFANSFEKTGLTGAFNLYRNITSTWELMAPWTNKGLETVTLFMTGDQDLCVDMFPPEYFSGPYKYLVPKSKGTIILPGIGHFLPEEAPELVNQHLLKFFQDN